MSCVRTMTCGVVAMMIALLTVTPTEACKLFGRRQAAAAPAAPVQFVQPTAPLIGPVLKAADANPFASSTCAGGSCATPQPQIRYGLFGRPR